MTTISHNRKKRSISTPHTIALVCVVIVIVLVAIFRSQAGGLFWQAAAPLVALRDSIDATQNAQLRAELASTTAQLADRDALYQENLFLKSQFGRDILAHRILAGVLQRPPGIPYDTLLIDAGQEQGITAGDLVSAGGTMLIGKVSDVYKATARVILFSAPGESYQALLHASSSPNGTLPISVVGEGGGSMSAEIPSGTQVSVGDPVFFPGIASDFTGSVSYVDIKSGQSFETIFVQLPVDIFSLQFVEVLPQSS